MKSAMEPLPEDPRRLREIIYALQDELSEAKQNYQQLLEQFRIARHRQFGQSSEANVDQLGLFNEAEAELEEEPVEDTAPDAEPRSRKNRPKRKPLPKDLPRERVVHDLDDKTCSGCGHQLHRIGEETREQLEFIPAQIKVIEQVRPKYACRHCEQQGTESTIHTAPVPPSPIPKSIATPSLLAQIICGKYQHALPLYRQEALFAQYRIELNRKTMAEWMIKSATLLEPLIQQLKTILLQQTVIQADETPLTK